jgi:FAD/FMN-containing dehydrogenase
VLLGHRLHDDLGTIEQRAEAGAVGTPQRLPAERAWARSFRDALRPLAIGNDVYVNMSDELTDEHRVRASYGPAKYERLARIKAKYDPNNLFHRNANIRPAVHR